MATQSLSPCAAGVVADSAVPAAMQKIARLLPSTAARLSMQAGLTGIGRRWRERWHRTGCSSIFLVKGDLMARWCSGAPSSAALLPSTAEQSQQRCSWQRQTAKRKAFGKRSLLGGAAR